MASGLIDQIKTLVITLHRQSLSVSFVNQSAQAYFKAHLQVSDIVDLPISEIFPNVHFDRLLKRLALGRPSDFVIDFAQQQESVPIQFTLSQMGNDHLLLEGINYSAVRETEHMLKSYSELIEKSNKKYRQEQRRVERLLFNTLPEKCVAELREYGRTRPERFTEVSVLFLDFVGFTELTQTMSTDTLFRELNELFTAFDTIITCHHGERIKTIGDAYLAVCGMPKSVEQHANLIVSAAYKMRAFVHARNQMSPYTWQCRIGIHTGELTGGVVGRLKYIYDVFGDGVNTASRMETHAEVMKINLSAETAHRLLPEYKLHSRGVHQVKGKGLMEMFYLEDIEGDPCAELLLEPSALLTLDPTDEEFMVNFNPFEES